MSYNRTFKFRLYPNRQQQKTLQNNLDASRWVYNKFVESTRNGFLSRNDMNYMLTEIKQQEPWLYGYHSKMLQMISTQVAAAQKSLIESNKRERKTGNLKFVEHDQHHTLIFNQCGFRLDKCDGKDVLWLSKIGLVRIRKHREVSGEIKQISISRSKSGKWHACITCDINFIVHMPKIDYKKSIGIDVGIKNFVCDSDGQVTPNPKRLTKMLRPIARMQRRISRRQKGSKNHKKAVKFYQIVHERIANRRKNFLHHVSSQYAKNYEICFVEKLRILDIVKNNNLGRYVLDAGWRMFIQMLKYKCMVIEVSAWNTTVECSRCGNMVPKPLSVRIHRCNKCGLVLDRDHNAAINILQRGLKILNLPQELREVTPVEIPKKSLKQEIDNIDSSQLFRKLSET